MRIKRIIITYLAGIVGGHYYLLKDYKHGLIYTFTCGLLGIGWIIDIYKAIVDKPYLFSVEKMINAKPSQTNELLTKSSITNDHLNLELNNIIKNAYRDRISQNMPDSYVIIDTETTGLNVNEEKIIEIAAIKYINHKKVDQCSYLINPGKPINAEITKITGITNDDVESAPYFNEITENLIGFISNFIIIGYNVSFDIKFLVKEFYESNVIFPDNKVYDIYQLARKTIRGVENYKLQTLKEHFDIKNESHRAMSDCLTTQDVYLKCIEIINNEKIAKLNLLNEDEQKVIFIVEEILKSNNNSNPKIDFDLNSNNILSIYNGYYPIFRIKCRGKLKYVLFSDELTADCNYFDFKVENAKKNDIGKYRLFYTDINSIYNLKNYIINNFKQSKINK